MGRGRSPAHLRPLAQAPPAVRDLAVLGGRAGVGGGTFIPAVKTEYLSRGSQSRSPGRSGVSRTVTPSELSRVARKTAEKAIPMEHRRGSGGEPQGERRGPGLRGGGSCPRLRRADSRPPHSHLRARVPSGRAAPCLRLRETPSGRPFREPCQLLTRRHREIINVRCF